MQDSTKKLLKEFCFIAHTRNKINARRHQARYRKNYYANALKVVEAHLGTNSELRSLDPATHQARIDQIKKNMAFLRSRFKSPTKWMNLGRYQLRSLILKATSEYALAKHETMEFSLKTTARVKEILKLERISITYNNGSIGSIKIRQTVKTPTRMHEEEIWLNANDIKTLADEYELDQAVVKMVEE